MKPLFFTLILSITCAFAGEKEQKVSSQAHALAQSSIIIDGHIDVPYRLYKSWDDVTVATRDGDFDYPRAKAGGLNAPFMAIYVPASLDDSSQSTQLAHQLIDTVEAITARAPNRFAIARSTSDIYAHFSEGIISLPMGMENGSPLQGNLDNLVRFHQRGVRYITLAHSQSNHISDSSYDLRRQWKGLSPFGKTLIGEMNRIGMMIDVSHISDQAFYQVIALSKTPVIASHSSLRRFTPGFERNMDEPMVKALAEKGGVIMINFGSGFVSPEARQWRDQLTMARNRLIQEEGDTSPKLATFEQDYTAQHPYPFSTLAKVLDHIDYVVNLVGIDYVGLGSDFDGVGNTLPEGLKDVSMYPHLVQGLLDRGYAEDGIKKILGGNLLRVWKSVEDFAASNTL